ncbi:1970_t:CDS:2 [Acaulospora colombiana]|uniref:1970_t:CDS:1 n=1 Tax=Acaulospora colombiana TaxID=27376 RepID=A0ACA9KI78_9GLOM|nr:1970_t:CDS:2 [Acaulospora colombiana]
MQASLLTLPAEIIADIFSFLDLTSLLSASRPEGQEYRLLQNLSCISCIPRRNWLHILTLGPPSLILYNDIPWLPDDLWGEAFMIRFLPSWTKWKRAETWKKTFRLFAPCTSDESWTSYVMLSRQGIVNFNSAYSRQFDPHAILDVYKEQNNIRNQPSTTRLIVQLADVKIIAIGTLGKATAFRVNRLAKEFMHPTGIYPPGVKPLVQLEDEQIPASASSDGPQYPHPPNVGIPMTRSITLDPTPSSQSSLWKRLRSGTFTGRPTSPNTTQSMLIVESVPLSKEVPVYSRLTHPLPVENHRNFPLYTPGGKYLRWPKDYDGTNEEFWVGPMLYVLLSPFLTPTHVFWLVVSPLF